MYFYLNYGEYTNINNKDNLDQILCLSKGNLSILAVTKENFKTVNLIILFLEIILLINYFLKLEENNKKLTKRILKNIDYFEQDLNVNECIYIPENRIFAIKSNSAWVYSSKLNQNCYLIKNENNLTKKAHILYPLDKSIEDKFNLV